MGVGYIDYNQKIKTKRKGGVFFLEKQPLLTKKNTVQFLVIVLAVAFLIAGLWYVVPKKTEIEKIGFHADWFVASENRIHAMYSLNKYYESPYHQEINEWVQKDVISEAGKMEGIKIHLGIIAPDMSDILAKVKEEEKAKTIQQAGLFYNGAKNDMQVMYVEEPFVVNVTAKTKFHTEKDVVSFTGISMLEKEELYVFVYQNEELVAVKEYPTPYRFVETIYLLPLNYVTQEQETHLLEQIGKSKDKK